MAGSVNDRMLSPTFSKNGGFVHSLFEMAVDVLKRTADVRSNKAIRDAIASSNHETIVGKVQWDGKGLPPFAKKNVTKTPLVGGQWRHLGGNKYDLVITDNKTAPHIPVTSDMQAIT